MTAAGGAISLVVGSVLLRLSIGGTYQRYVRAEMGPWLAIAGAVLVVLGLTALLRRDEEHAHSHSPRVGWLLLAPIAALLLVTPPSLGSYGVDRGPRVDVRAGASDLEPLEPGTEAIPMTLLEFSQRAFDHDGRSFGGATVQLTGFVADDASDDTAADDGFRLARYQIACCAADAAPLVVRVAGITGAPPPRDRWVTVAGTFRPGRSDTPELAATSVVEIPPPDDPYE